MSDFYTEYLVKQKPSGKTYAIKAALIAVTVCTFLLMFSIPFGFFIPMIMIFVDVFMFRRLDLEFEYLYVNGDLDIDKIMAKQSRKRVFSTNVKDIEIMARVGYAELKPYERLKTIDCSSAMPNHKIYGLVANYKGQNVMILFEPNEIIVKGMRMLAPRKVLV